MFLPWPGGPKEVYDRFEEEHGIARGPEGIYMQPLTGPALDSNLGRPDSVDFNRTANRPPACGPTS